MTAENQISIIITQDLTNGELKVSSEGKRLSFPIATQMVLSALKGLKNNIITNITTLPEHELFERSFPNGTVPDHLKGYTPEQIREDIALRAEGEMYDLLNLSISNFLDVEFPRVNSKLSLTEQAAEQAGLDSSATPEELIAAENKFIEDNPELAAQTQELQPKKILRLHIDKNGKPTAHPGNLAGGSNRATRRLNKK